MAQVAQARTQNQRVLIAWDSQGKKTDPAANTVMADTGQIATIGDFRATVLASASAAAIMTVQHRNAANNGSVTDDQIIYVPAGGTVAVERLITTTAALQRVRVIMNANLTGTAGANITLEGR